MDNQGQGESDKFLMFIRDEEEVGVKKGLISFIQKDGLEMQMALEGYLNQFELIDEFEERPRGMGDVVDSLSRGLFGCTTKIYEVKSEGVMLYYLANTLRGYVASIKLLGFDEKTDSYRKIKRDLEEISRR